MKQTAVEWLFDKINDALIDFTEGKISALIYGIRVTEYKQQAKEMERELIKESCIMAIMQWNEWDKTNYLDLYDHKIEGAEIWAEDYCKELYEEIEVPNPKQETHICKYCNAETWQSDDECYLKPKSSNDHIVDTNKKVSSIEWLRKKLLKDFGIAFSDNIFEQAKEMHKQEIIDAYKFGISDEFVIGSENYYNETFVAQK